MCVGEGVSKSGVCITTHPPTFANSQHRQVGTLRATIRFSYVEHWVDVFTQRAASLLFLMGLFFAPFFALFFLVLGVLYGHLLEGQAAEGICQS